LTNANITGKACTDVPLLKLHTNHQ